MVKGVAVGYVGVRAAAAELRQRRDLSAPPLRAQLARFLRAALPSLHVLAWNEIPDNRKVRVVTAVGR